MSKISAILALVVASLIFNPHPLRAQETGAGPSRLLFDSANQARAGRGLPALRWDGQLAAAARLHALRMARNQAISHRFPGEATLAVRSMESGAHFSEVAENVAVGATASLIQTMWMHSPHHRENILDPELNSLGVAVVEDNGYLFAVEDFSQSVVPLSPKQQEGRLTGELRARGIAVHNDPQAAAQACRGRFAGDVSFRRAFLLRYTTEDIGRMPNLLEQKIRTGLFSSAAVGACSPAVPVTFTQYRLAVLLYE